jgi:hypothetical protein
MTNTAKHLNEPGNAGPGRRHSSCDRYPLLPVLELAHRDVTGRPACLRQEDLPGEDIRRHLEEGCPVCGKWYRNAWRAYARNSGVPEPAPRPLERQKSGAAGSGHGLVEQQAVPRREGGSKLDALTLILRWSKASGSSEGPWRLALCFPGEAEARAGNLAAELRAFDGFPVLVELHTEDEDAPRAIATRLALDREGNLVSPQKIVRVEQPDRVCAIELIPGTQPVTASPGS